MALKKFLVVLELRKFVLVFQFVLVFEEGEKTGEHGEKPSEHMWCHTFHIYICTEDNKRLYCLQIRKPLNSLIYIKRIYSRLALLSLFFFLLYALVY